MELMYRINCTYEDLIIDEEFDSINSDILINIYRQIGIIGLYVNRYASMKQVSLDEAETIVVHTILNAAKDIICLHIYDKETIIYTCEALEKLLITKENNKTIDNTVEYFKPLIKKVSNL